MNSYITYEIEDFVLDEHFRAWVLFPTAEYNAFWHNWVAEHPEKKDTIEAASKLVKDFQIVDLDIPEARIQNGIEKVILRTEQKIIPFYSSFWFKYAASVLFVIGVSFYLLKPQKQNAQVLSQVIEDKSEIIENTQNTSKKIVLPDGSIVLLEKNSKLSYKKGFGKDKREIELTGQALFDVIKDPTRPFYVYAGNTTTRVLGTSFTVRAFVKEKNVIVDVIRGKVSVTTHKPSNKSNKGKKLTEEVVLLPNQQVVYNNLEEKIEKSISANPRVIAPVEVKTKQLFVFREGRVTRIFKTLEDAYGVQILYDKNRLKTCALTTNLTDEPLYNQLAIICKSIGAEYHTEGVKIIITGGDCGE